MQSSEISKIVEEEIGGDWSLSNLHGVDLQKCLVLPPVKQVFKDSFREGETIELWVVLQTEPGKKSGYKIVFDEETRRFGLVTPGFTDMGVFIGFNGTFLDVFRSM